MIETAVASQLRFTINLRHYIKDYASLIDYINQLSIDKEFRRAIDNSYFLIQELQAIKHKIKAEISTEFYQLIRACVKLNQENYTNLYIKSFQEQYQQNYSYLTVITFFNNQIAQAENIIEKKEYLRATNILSALTKWVNLFVPPLEAEFPSLLSNLISNCNARQKYTYFCWLKNDYLNCIEFHFLPSNSKLTLRKLIHTNYYILVKEYSKSIDLQTSLLKNLDKLLGSIDEDSKLFQDTWQKYLIFQRQQTAFNWLIQNHLVFLQQIKYCKMLRKDLIALTEESGPWKAIELEAQCKLDLIHLLLLPTADRTKFNTLRQTFCSAFDIFCKFEDKPNIALSLFGLAVINAYEGEKQQMRMGLKCAIDYDEKLELLKQTTFDKLSFFMQPISKIQFTLVNPFFKWQRIESEELPLAIAENENTFKPY